MGQACRCSVGESNSLDSVEGLVKCSVLAPRDLYHPVLPYRAHDKLLFLLYRKCCEELNQGECDHENIADHVFTGTWVSDELKRDVSVGYRVTAVYEIWQHKTVRHDEEVGENGLFVGYINTFLKLKQEASGYPADCTIDQTEETTLKSISKTRELN